LHESCILLLEATHSNLNFYIRLFGGVILEFSVVAEKDFEEIKSILSIFTES
jgi:hypothetical protein